MYTALVTLSLDKFLANIAHKPTAEASSPTAQGPVVELSAGYGRALPISEEEVAAINVSRYAIIIVHKL